MHIGTVFGDGTGRLRTVWRMLLFVVAMAVTLVALQLAGVLILGVFLPPPARDVLAEQPLLWMSVLGPFVTAGTLGVVFLFRMLVDRRDVVSIGLGAPGRAAAASPVTGLLLGMAAAGVPVLALLAAGALTVERVGMSFATVLAVPALAFGAFTEELAVRGYLLRNMLDVRRPVWGVLATSLLFALAHTPNPHFFESPIGAVNIFLSAIALAMAYMAAENLWLPTALHFGWNAAQGVLFGVPISGLTAPGLVRLAPAEGADRLLTGGDFGLEGSALATVSTGVLILILLALLRRKRRGAPFRGPALTEAPGNSYDGRTGGGLTSPC